MTSRVLLAAGLASFLFPLSLFACISTPKLEFKNKSTLSFSFDELNESAVENKLRESGVKDFSDLKELILHGYSAKEQTDEEYQAFLEKARKENQERPQDCSAYLAVSRKGRWTAFIKSGRLYNPKEGCLVPKCAGINAKIVWNEL